MRWQRGDRYLNQKEFERVLEKEQSRLCRDCTCEQCRKCVCNPCDKEKPCDKGKQPCDKREKSCRLSCKNHCGELEIDCNEDYRSIGIKLYDK